MENAAPSTTTTTENIRLARLCEECHRIEFQYQCPRCSFRSCSLACCQAHKQRTVCSGKRDRTAFVKVGDMSDATLANDYHFLEDVIGKIDANQRFLRQSGAGSCQHQQQRHPKRPRHSSWAISPADAENTGAGEQHALLQAARREGIASKRLILPVGEHISAPEHEVTEHTTVATTTPSTSTSNNISHHQQQQIAEAPAASAAAAVAPVQRQTGLSNLQNHARQRGVTLLRLPPFMERHKRNETCVRHQRIYWTVEWRVYPDHHHHHAGDGNQAAKDETKDRVLGDAKATGTTTTTTITNSNCTATFAHQTCETVILCDELRRLVVETADENLLARHSLLIKHELSPANAPKYSMVSSSAMLADALADQTIIEFPTFHVVPPARLKDFPLLIQSITGPNNETKK